MQTECIQTEFAFQRVGSRRVVARFDGGPITSDAGALLLRETERRTGILRQFAACFTDGRDPARIEHPLERLLAQRVYALALGYEDVTDHDALRGDPLLATVVGAPDPTGRTRTRARDRGAPLAGKSTLNRLELVRADRPHRYHKIVADAARPVLRGRVSASARAAAGADRARH